MSALPKPTPEGRPLRRDTQLLLDAFQADAGAQAKLRPSLDRIGRAVAAGAHEFDYAWQTPDGRDATIRVYYLPGEETRIMAGELTEIDYRRPTHRERAGYEEQFDTQMKSFGELWTDVASHVWERTASGR